ncbi:MAG: inorganic diphosphatase, partial [Pseudomonadota bacterium]
LPPHRMAEVQRFFEEYKTLENKVVEVKDFFDVDEAKKSLEQAKADYLAKFT